MKLSVWRSCIGIYFVLWLSACSTGYSYLPPPDAELSTGHLAVFFHELYAPELPEPENLKQTALLISIVQEGKVIISHEISAGGWGLYPVPEGVYTVDFEIDFLDNQTPFQRTFTSNFETVNAINIDIWRVEPLKLSSEFQTKKATFTGKTVQKILNAKRENKILNFAQIQNEPGKQK
jgi:hypothetical protein